MGTEVASIAHGTASNRIAITNLSTGETRMLPPVDEPIADPVWAPDASRLLFRAGDALMMFDIARQQTEQLETGLAVTGRAPYAYSPDGRLAFVRPRFVHVDADDDPRAGEPQRYPLPAGSSFVQMMWSGDGRMLFVLARKGDDAAAASLVSIDTTTRSSQTRALGTVAALIGWDPAADALVVARSRPELIGTEAVLLLPSGELRPMQTGEEDEAGQFAMAYLSDTRETIAQLGRDDLSDPVKLLILPFGGGGGRSWLQRFPRLDELAATSDGRCVFVDRGAAEAANAPGGDVYTVRCGEDDARLAVQSREGYTFSTPALSP
jgi:hypothetical protein